MPEAPDPPRWKETGQRRLRAWARRGLTEAKAGSGSRRRPGGPLRPLLRAARRAASPATLGATRPPPSSGRPSRPQPPLAPLLFLQGPSAAWESAHGGARGVPHSRDTRRPGRPPAGAPRTPALRRCAPSPRRCPGGAGPRVQPQTPGGPGNAPAGRGATMEERSAPLAHRHHHRSSFAETSPPAAELRLRPGVPPHLRASHRAEIVLGLLVWTLIAGTEYFRVPAFGWVMFVAVFYWVLTVFFLIIYITMTYTRIPQVPWTTVGLCFNSSAFVLYLSAAVVDASSVSPERDSHNFNSWAASSFFAFLVTICYAGNTYFSFIAWRSRTVQ
nr:CKLF-like MARVEL transmembrane domain-containing protein 8 [Aotus nancymaae]